MLLAWQKEGSSTANKCAHLGTLNNEAPKEPLPVKTTFEYLYAKAAKGAKGFHTGINRNVMTFQAYHSIGFSFKAAVWPIRQFVVNCCSKLCF